MRVVLGFGWLGCVPISLGFQLNFWDFGIAPFSSKSLLTDLRAKNCDESGPAASFAGAAAAAPAPPPAGERLAHGTN